MSEARIDVQVEHKHAPPPQGSNHPNTCPKCGSHYRDDELESALWVCAQCGHHFPMRARARIDWYADADSFSEDAVDVRSDDPLHFFDLRPYAERLSEAELNTGLGEAIVIGQAAMDSQPVQLAVMDFKFMGGSMGGAVGEKFSRACDLAVERGIPLIAVPSSGGARMQEGILSLMQLPKTVVAVEELHDARAGERDQRARLRNGDVSQRSERREDARRGGVRHHRDHRDVRIVQILDRADGLRELHQREDPLLHPRAAG